MKYIVFEYTEGEHKGKKQAIVFPKELGHKDVSGMFPVFRYPGGRAIPRSAGFCEVRPNEGWVAWGESESMRMKAHPGDASIIAECYSQGSGA